MAQVRYMVGVMFHNEAEKLIAANGDRETIIGLLVGVKKDNGKRITDNSALGHLASVVREYPRFEWAPDAEARCRKIQEHLGRLGVEVRLDPSRNR